MEKANLLQGCHIEFDAKQVVSWHVYAGTR